MFSVTKILVEPCTKQAPPLPVVVELSQGNSADRDLSGRICQQLRDELIVSTEITMVAFGTLPRTDHKSKLVDRSQVAQAKSEGR